MNIKITRIKIPVPKMCECGRSYCISRNSEGKMMCCACYCDCSLEDLKILYSTPAPENMLNIFKKPKLPTDHNEKGN
jgi:hypothetical protein